MYPRGRHEGPQTRLKFQSEKKANQEGILDEQCKSGRFYGFSQELLSECYASNALCC
jgi:hypothetical protein